MARIIGPRHVIKAELVAGREWAELVSPSGVVCYVSQLAKRALCVGPFSSPGAGIPPAMEAAS